MQKTITRTVEYKYADGTQAHEPVKQELTFTGKGTIDLVTGNLVTVDKDGNITSQNGKITWNHDSQEFEVVPAIDHDGYFRFQALTKVIQQLVLMVKQVL